MVAKFRFTINGWSILAYVTLATTQGYTKFNMGMATLSNVGQVHYSYLRERLAGRVFEHFNGLYRFQGLRRYKSKYNPNWEPRFLVYRKDNSL